MTTRGGVSKAQKGLHLNEDIYAGMNAFGRGGRIKRTGYYQCGKGRDLGSGTILNFMTKIGTGMGEQIGDRSERTGWSRDQHTADDPSPVPRSVLELTDRDLALSTLPFIIKPGQCPVHHNIALPTPIISGGSTSNVTIPQIAPFPPNQQLQALPPWSPPRR
jgi:hypothetical protein